RPPPHRPRPLEEHGQRDRDRSRVQHHRHVTEDSARPAPYSLSVRADVVLQRVNDANDPGVVALVALLEQTLADPDTLLGLERVRGFLDEPDAAREFRVLLARRDEAVVGGSMFSYVPAANCGFSEYIVVARDERGSG